MKSDEWNPHWEKFAFACFAIITLLSSVGLGLGACAGLFWRAFKYTAGIQQ